MRESTALLSLKAKAVKIGWVVIENPLEISRADPVTRTIYSSPLLKGIKRTLDMAHELGHALLFEDGRDIPDPSWTNSSKYELLATELLAWERAWIVLNELGISISRKRFAKEAGSAFMSYVKWAASGSKSWPWI